MGLDDLTVTLSCLSLFLLVFLLPPDSLPSLRFISSLPLHYSDQLFTSLSKFHYHPLWPFLSTDLLSILIHVLNLSLMSDTDSYDIVDHTAVGYQYAGEMGSGFPVAGPYGGSTGAGRGERVSESFGDHAREFLMACGEMAVEFGKGCRDIFLQSLGDEHSYLARKFGKGSYIEKRIRGPCEMVCRRLSFFSENLPEDKDPMHAWLVILFVSVIAFAALSVNMGSPSPSPPLKKVNIHPPCAERILLPDGRYLAYKEQGVPAEKARFSMIAAHSFLSSRLAGLPGIKPPLLEEFGIRLLTYDLPGFGESDPHPTRNLESSALDMAFFANAMGVNDKFWVVGYSSGGIHAWAALRYIPDKIAGAALFSPMISPYEPSMTKEERRGTWEKWTRKRKFMYFLAWRFPTFLPYFYHRSFLSGKHCQVDKCLSLSLEKRDRALIEDPIHGEFWQRDVEESIRQGNAKPFVEEAVLQVSDWGFRLADLKFRKKQREKGIVNWLKSVVTEAQEEYTGFLGPIHVWQGMDDKVVPPSMTDFVHRVLPGVAVHKLPYEGHFTYIYFCDECHRQIFTTLVGTPQGPLTNHTTYLVREKDDTQEVQYVAIDESVIN